MKSYTEVVQLLKQVKFLRPNLVFTIDKMRHDGFNLNTCQFFMSIDSDNQSHREQFGEPVQNYISY